MANHRMTPEELLDRLHNAANRIEVLVEALPNSRLGRRIADQLLRSGTSVAPNYEEACAAESPRDFVHKLGICLKELRESRAWIRMTIDKKMFPQSRVQPLLDEVVELCKIIGKSVLTARQNMNKGKRPKPDKDD